MYHVNNTKKIEISPNALMKNDLIKAVGSWLDYPKNASFSREVRFEMLCKIYSDKKFTASRNKKK